MKKYISIICILILLITGSVLYLNLSGGNINVHKYQINESEQLIEYLKNSDISSIKSKFSRKSLEKCDDIDIQITQMIDLLGGKIESVGEIKGGGESISKRNGKVTKLCYDVTINDIITTEGQKYKIQFFSVPINDLYPEKKGIEIIGIDDYDGNLSFNIGVRN